MNTDIGDEGGCRGDMHMHTTVSDGRASPEEVVLVAVEKGLDFIAVTDHDSFEGAIRARRAAASAGLDLVVIIGSEVRTTRGDILVYCMEGPPSRVPRDPLELRDYMRGENCLVVPAHPFDKRRKGIGELVYEGGWDALEVFNAYSDPWSNRRAEEAARQLGLPGLANSDAHVPEAIGAAYNIVYCSDFTAEAILEAIRRGSVKPVPGRPGARVYLGTLAWSIERRVMRKKKGPSRLDYLEDEGIPYEG